MPNLKSRIASRTLNWYLAKNRNRRSEEDLGTDDPHASRPDANYVEANSWYILPNVVPNRGPGGFINGGHGP